MKDTKTHRWIAVFAVTLTLTGAVASFYASKETFYRGLEPLTEVAVSTLKTSVVQFDEAPITTKGVDNPVIPQSDAAANAPQRTEAAFQEKENKNVAPCPAGSTPVVRDGKVSACRNFDTFTAPTAALQAAPVAATAPKVKILPPTCEDQGLLTYTGPDRPGLLYGMCIPKP